MSKLKKKNLSLSEESLRAVKDMIQWMASQEYDMEVLAEIERLLPAHKEDAAKLLTLCYGQHDVWHKNQRIQIAMKRIKFAGGKDYNRLFWALRPAVAVS